MSGRIEIRNLTKTYPGPDALPVKAVDGVSLSILPGEIVGVLGPAGSGKTTLIQIVGGYLEPTTGHVWLDGYDVVGERPQALRQVQTVLAEDEQLPDSVDASIVLLDEPKMALRRGWLQGLARDYGKAVLLATHNLDRAQAFCDRLALLDQGRLVAELSAGELHRLRHRPFYRLQIHGHLDADLSDWFDDLALEHTAGGDTTLTGMIQDQAALHGLLIKVRDLGLPILSLNPVEPGLAQILHALDRGTPVRDAAQFSNG